MRGTDKLSNAMIVIHELEETIAHLEEDISNLNHKLEEEQEKC